MYTDIVLPATNAVSERCASALRRVKTYLRTTMSQTKLNNIEKKLTNYLWRLVLALSFQAKKKNICMF